MRPLSALILTVALLSGCVPPGSAGRMEHMSHRGEAPSSSQGITLLAGPPQGMDGVTDGWASVLVTVINRGRRPLRLQRGHLRPGPQLASRDGLVAAEAMAAPVEPGRGQRAEAFPEGTLAPGETARGYLYFAGASSDALQVQARLVDANTGEVIDILAAPLATGRRDRP